MIPGYSRIKCWVMSVVSIGCSPYLTLYECIQVFFFNHCMNQILTWVVSTESDSCKFIHNSNLTIPPFLHPLSLHSTLIPSFLPFIHCIVMPNSPNSNVSIHKSNTLNGPSKHLNSWRTFVKKHFPLPLILQPLQFLVNKTILYSYTEDLHVFVNARFPAAIFMSSLWLWKLWHKLTYVWACNTYPICLSITVFQSV